MIMNDKTSLTVEGFAFPSEADAELARQETQKIEYLEKRMNYKLPENMLAVYNKVLENKLIRTPVGWNYLRNMQTRMTEAGIKPEQIQPIPLFGVFDPRIYNDDKSGVAKQKIKSNRKREKTALEKIRFRFQAAVVVIVILLVLAAAMFVILLQSDHPTIVNYEKAILDKYASWEQELTEREQVLREKESEYR